MKRAVWLNRAYIALSALSFLYLNACNYEVEVTSAKADVGAASAIVPELGEGEGEDSADATPTPPGPAASAPLPAIVMNYNLEVRFVDDVLLSDLSETPICTGGIALTFKTDFEPEPNVTLNCLGIDLSGLINNANIFDSVTGLQVGLENIFYEDGIVKLDSLMGAQYNPPRPVFIKPFFYDTQDYVGFSSTINTTVTAENLLGNPVSEPGTMTLNVVDMSTPFEVSGLDVMAETAHFTIDSTGFEGVSPLSGLTFERLELWYSPAPLALPKINLAIDTTNVLGLNLPLLPNDLVISLDLTSQETLRPFAPDVADFDL